MNDPERSVRLAEDLVAAADLRQPVCLLQCGGPSALVNPLSQVLTLAGRRAMPLVVTDRQHARSETVIGKLTSASAVWVFADNLLEAFFTVFATPVAFVLRARASGS